MAGQTAAGCRGGLGANNTETDDNNGYVQVFVKPIEQGAYNGIVNYICQTYGKLWNGKLTSGMICLCSSVAVCVIAVIVMYSELGALFDKLASILMPICCITFGFYGVSLYLRKTWGATSIYIVFCSCFLAEFVGQFVLNRGRPSVIVDVNINYSSICLHPILIVFILITIATTCHYSNMETKDSILVVLSVNFSRLLACLTLPDLPDLVKPSLAYCSGIVGVLAAKYMETIFKPPVNSFMTVDGKIPIIKRRRSSSSSNHGFSAHRVGRRTSLPALIQSKSQIPAAGYESGLVAEAHGLLTDMMADTHLPPHIISGLRAVSNLLKPQENHFPVNKPKISPLVSLAEAANYGSDTEDLPYTGERPSTLPRRLRRSLPPSLLRRMSTSTWTTTTSATGMPTLEPEPCRVRSASFRHSRDNTPGSSPINSRSNSPSPSSPTTTLAIPKSRSFSIATTGQLQPPPPRRGRRNKSMYCIGSHDLGSPNHPPTDLKPFTIEIKPLNSNKRLIVTSDYESSDSPSDHSDNIGGIEDNSGSGGCGGCGGAGVKTEHIDLNTQHSIDDVDNSTFQDENEHHKGDEEAEEDEGSSSTAAADDVIDTDNDNDIFDISDLDRNELLHISKLSIWDYPIFTLADDCKQFILSKVAYKLFMEVGLFETFRISRTEFLNYFHALEIGYRDKPYHNRIHATDVLHGVYFLTSQPIPGFVQIIPEDDSSNTATCNIKHDTDSEIDRPTIKQRTSFVAEDTYGIMGGNLPALELMAMYTAAAMHDYDHPGRTNAFLVATHATQAILYNDRSVLENHHAAAAWNLLLEHPKYNWLKHLDKSEFKRFRYLVIEAILATDLKRHFEILAEFNAKCNDDVATGLDWSSEADRLLVSQIIIKLADINGPAKTRDLHIDWTDRITEEFYEQGDEEASLGMPISPFMDRRSPQLAKLQQSFINHLVAPLVNACSAAGLIPGQWIEDESDNEASLSDTEPGIDTNSKDAEEDAESDTSSYSQSSLSPNRPQAKTKKIACILTKNLKDNLDMWLARIKEEQELENTTDETENIEVSKKEMEPIAEEESTSPTSRNEPQQSLNSVKANG
ncbi:cGMP-inhibited 3',5'-cyclic phosphodiesterase 3A-like [Tubulanus polymorphus]|uniref:cGMP-inhibited 3',5'-cyclic phosphodiesterase 3A-like n=1 Tax=Tubulanus polymorphus TaxID=672921 RepID=UPI003DA397A4